MMRGITTASTSQKIAQKVTQYSNIANNKGITLPIGKELFYRQIRRCVTRVDRHQHRHLSPTATNCQSYRRAYHPSPQHHSTAASQPHITQTVHEIIQPVNYEDDIAAPIRQHHQLHRPLVIRNATAFLSSPQLKLWKDTSYLQRTVGEEAACDIEIGGSFDRIGAEHDTAVTSSSIQFGDYISYLDMAIETYNDTDDGGTPLETKDIVYLAQNEIFNGLKEDFTPPKFCTDGTVGRGGLYATKIWIGPAGTVSSLHYDPLDNVLLQVVGQKVVTLYPPVPPSSLSEKEEEDENGGTDCYYAGKGPSRQMNVSAVDIERPDLEKFPNFRSAMSLGSKVTLREGDMLFIPKRWWHHVRGDSVWSLSLNCWWD